MRRLLLLILFTISYTLAWAQTAVPTNFKAQQVNLENKVKLDWTAPSGTFTGYELVYSNTTTSVTDTMKLGKVSTYTIDGLTFENTYSFKLRTYDSTKFSAFTSALQVPIVRLNKPTITAASNKITHDAFELTITDANKFKTGFTIEISSDAGTTLKNVTSTSNTYTETITGLKSNTNYKIRVKTLYNTLQGDWSSQLSINTKSLTAPSNPSALTAAQVELQKNILLFWTASPSNISGYTLYYKKGNETEKSVNIGKVTTYNLTNIDYEATYSLRMKSFIANQGDTIWASSFTPSVSVIVTELKAPQMVAEKIAIDSITVKFTDSNQFETGFIVEFDNGVTIVSKEISGAKTTFSETFNGLKANTNYKIRVRTKRNSLLGAWSSWLSIKTIAHNPPALPTNFTAAQVNLEDIIKLNWTAAPEPINGYVVYFKNDSQTKEDSVKIGKVSTYSLANLTLETTYSIRMKTFKVVSKDTVWSSTFTPTLKVELAKLDAPTLKVDTATIKHKSFELTITDKNKFETGFEIAINKNDTITTVLIDKKGDIIKHLLQNLTPKTTYKVRVRPIKEKVTGTWSTWLEVKTKIDVPAEAILQLNSPCPQGIEFTWSYASRANEIATQTLYKSTNQNIFTDSLRINLNVNAHIDPNIVDGQTYYFKIVTRNISGSTHSKILKVEVPKFIAPSVPLNVQSLQTNKSVNHLFFTWQHGETDEKCKTNVLKSTEIAVRINNAPLKIIGKVNEHITYIKIDSLNPRDKVEAFFRTYSDKNKISDWVSAIDSTLGAPYLPSNVIGVLNYSPIGNPELHISWKDNSFDEDYFRIEKSIDGINFFPFTFTLSNVTKVIDTDIEEGKSYYYRVQSGSWVDVSEFTPPVGPFKIQYSAIPNAPYGLQAVEVNKKVILRWVDDSIREDGFIIEKSEDNANQFKILATTEADQVQFEDSNVEPGKTYVYRIKAVNSKGSSAYSKTESIVLKKEGLNINVYPNPISDILNIQFYGFEKTSDVKIQIFNQNNHLMIDSNKSLYNSQEVSIKVNQLTPGSYTLIITDQKNETVAKRIIKI